MLTLLVVATFGRTKSHSWLWPLCVCCGHLHQTCDMCFSCRHELSRLLCMLVPVPNALICKLFCCTDFTGECIVSRMRKEILPPYLEKSDACDLRTSLCFWTSSAWPWSQSSFSCFSCLCRTAPQSSKGARVLRLIGRQQSVRTSS